MITQRCQQRDSATAAGRALDDTKVGSPRILIKKDCVVLTQTHGGERERCRTIISNRDSDCFFLSLPTGYADWESCEEEKVLGSSRTAGGRPDGSIG
jgi:hypothetical protein